MAFWLKKTILPDDILYKINSINDKIIIDKVKYNKILCNLEIRLFYENDERYKTHEFYFIQLVPFLETFRYKKNNDTTKHIYNKQKIKYRKHEIYDISLEEKLITKGHYLLYKDHANIFIYQYYNYNVFYYFKDIQNYISSNYINISQSQSENI
jgi:hypothetical protein